jgi:CRP-like cAMP-binding protein
LYFPETCIVSLLGVLANGDTSEVSLTGREGCVGLGLVLGGDSTILRATVQSAGTALRWKTNALRGELKRGGAVERMFLHYVQAVWSQTAQSALCNRHHTLEQQMCRWFLASLDRVNGNTLRMTQKLIANMLGVRRERVAMTAKRMRTRGWITYQNGTVVVLNRAALERCACECYEVVKAEYQRLFQRKRKKRDGGRKLR